VGRFERKMVGCHEYNREVSHGEVGRRAVTNVT